MASFPGRKFKKVPPKGRKPIGKPIRKEPFAPTYYEPFFNEYAWEKFFDDLNVTTWPKKTYMSAVKSLDGALNARYEPDRAIDIYTTKEEIEQLPGSQGSGVPVSLKEWLEHPEKVLEDTTDKWWNSVFNWEDFTQNMELKYIWKPLVDAGPAPGLNLTKPGPTGEPEGVRLIKTTFVEPISGVTKTTSYDAYGLLANDVLAWGKNQGNRSSRLGSFEAVQLDLLTILDSQLAEVNRANGPDFWQSKARAFGPSGEAWVKALDKFRDTNLGLVRVTDALKSTKLESTKDLNVTSFSQKALDTLSPGDVTFNPETGENVLAGRPIYATKRGLNSIQKRDLGDKFTLAVANTRGAQVAGIVGAQLGTLNPELATVATAAFSQINPKVRPLVQRNWELLNEEKRMQDALTAAWSSNLGILRKNSDFFKDVGLNVDDAKLDSAWMRLTHYRESQSTAYDFIEAIDSKSFFKFFVATGRVIGTNVPGLSQAVKFLSPSDYAREALKKVNYFGLTGVFGDGSAEGGARLLSRPFAAATKLLESNPLLSKVVNVGSLGLIDTVNFTFVTYKDSGTAFKVLAPDFSFMKGIAGGLIDKSNSDWKVLNLLNTAAQAKDYAGNEILSSAQLAELFSGTMDLDSKKLLLEGLSLNNHLVDGEIGKIFRTFEPFKPPVLMTGDELKAAFDHFAEKVAGSDEMKAILQKYGVMDEFGVIDPKKLPIFLKKITEAKLGNRYIGVITSIGQNMDRLQSRVFTFAYSKIPGLEGTVKTVRGGWVKLAMMDTKLIALAVNKWIVAKGTLIIAKLGIKGALKIGLKALGTALMGVVEALSNAAPVVGPLLTAALTWFVQKLWSKVLKRPTIAVGKAIYRVALGSWLFTDYGVLGTGENLKTCGCVGCGCVFVFFIGIPLFVMGVIGGANYKFADEGLTPAVSENIAVSKTLDKAQIPVGVESEVTYTISVRNIGTDALIGLNVTDSYPNPDNIVISSTCTGNLVATPEQAAVAVGESKTFNCKLRINSTTARFLTNSVQVTAGISGVGTSVSAVATATLKIGDPQVVAPCGYPGVISLRRGSEQPTIIYGCAWEGHASRPAVDIPYSKGTILQATIAGEATRCVITTEEEQRGDSYGIYVDVVGAGYTERVGHLSPEAGDDVLGCRSIGHKNVGDIIGYSGDTGNSSGPHTHYEIIKNGVAICPEPYVYQTAPECGGS